MSVIVGKGSSRMIPSGVQRSAETASENLEALTYWYLGISLDTAEAGALLPSCRHECRSNLIQ